MMFRFITQIQKQGKVVIPAKVRKMLELKHGDYIELQISQIKKKED